MTQAELFTQSAHGWTARYPQRPGAKASGTSEAAAPSVNLAATLRELVLHVLRKHGPMSADQIADVLGESVLAVRPRASELRAMGKVEDSRKRATNQSGKSAIVWRIVR